MKFRDDYLAQLLTCLDSASEWHRVERCFREELDDDADEDARPVVWAFGYMLVGRRREEPRERSGIFAPMIVWENGASFPPPLDTVGNEVAPVWAQYAEGTASFPLAASRLHDLLWVLGFGERAVDHAHAAIDAYLKLGATMEKMDLVDCISRAIEIAKEIGDRESITAGVQRAVAVIEDEINEPNERRPGIPMNLLEDLADLGVEHQPENLMQLIEAAGERYGADPWIAQSVSELETSLGPAEEREARTLEQVERWRTEAKKGDGLLRHVHLQHALELARKHGHAKAAKEILLELQSITPDQLDLKQISAEVKIPRDEIDPYIESFREQPSWQVALGRFAFAGPPIKADPGDQAEPETTLSRLFPTQILGAEGSLIFGAADEDEHDRVEKSRNDALRVQIWGTFSVEVLETIFEKFGSPGRDELVNFLTTDLIDASVAARIADAFLRFIEGDDDAALHIAIPQLEAVVRSAARNLGIVVIKNPQGERPGGVRQLGALLADLKGRMDEDWRRYLVNALNDSLGLNLRDQVSHGLYGPVSRSHLGIVLHLALYLHLLEPTADSPSEG